VLAVQALAVTVMFAGSWRVPACWVGLVTEPLWIAYAFVGGKRSWGFAALGGVYLLTYIYGIVRG
jgi:hypothetical protein